MNKLAIEALLGAQPGVIDLSFERSERGAILLLRAVVENEKAERELREAVASAIGSQFADERLLVVTMNKAQPEGESAAGEPGPPPIRLNPRETLPALPVTSAPPPPASIEKPKMQVTQIATNVRPGQTEVDVTLEAGGRTVTGSEGGPSFAGSALRFAALATISAIGQLDDGFDGRLDHVGVETVSGEKVVIVAIALKPKPSGETWQRLHGVAAVDEGTPEAAAARAILNALSYST